MGASCVTQVIKGETPLIAYNDAHNDACSYHGSSGYTGTIAESSGMFVVDGAPLLRWDAERKAQTLIDMGTVDKWGPTALVPLAEIGSSRIVKVAVDATGLGWAQKQEVIARTLHSRLKDGESIQDVKIVEATPRIRITATSGKGTTRTVYMIDQDTRHTFPNLTEAKQWAVSYMESRAGGPHRITISKRVVRVNGEPIASVTRDVVKQIVEVTATVGYPKAGAPTGWVAVGVYSE